MQRKLRQSQTLVPFGVGAILDFRGESFVACDTFRWGHRGEPLHSERLAAALGVRGFRSAPTHDSSLWGAPSTGVPYARFPSWLFCQSCRRMVRWHLGLEQEGKVPVCPQCESRAQLVPMRWIQVCPAGHMDDLDWRRWAHSRRRTDDPDARQCQHDDRLSFETLRARGGGGLDTLQVRCRVCGSARTLQGITSKTALGSIGLRCAGRQPWQRWDERSDCAEVPLAVQRGASNVYFPTVHSSIEIPRPSSSAANTEKALEIMNDALFPALLSVNEDSPATPVMIDQLVSAHDVTAELVRALLRDERSRQEGRATVVDATSGDLLSEEWAAFITPDADDSVDFRTRHVGLGDIAPETPAVGLAGRIDRVVVADRIREVRALEGFHRVSPSGRQSLVKVDLGRGLTWLPATEVRGEGVFLSLEESRLAAWESLEPVVDRTAEMDGRIDRSFMAARLRERTGPRLEPRYLLLHTLAHLLMRRLAFESGYSAASIRERIYARSPIVDGESRQAGILLYTAAGDSEGTLGGLVRQGEPPRLVRTVMEALQSAAWCSADPLCGENLATGFTSLNFAACHACALAPETSCEAGNFLLDRSLVVGSDEVPGYFQVVVQAAIEAAAAAAAADT